jgi:hypothetical protein
MKDLTSPTWILIKGGLFLVLGLIAGALLLIQRPTLYVGFLLITAVWAFCRFYYFAFYVIEHYVDSNYRYAGLLSFARYLIQREQQRP